MSGYIFTGWTSSDTSVFAARDRLGRTLESARLTVYGETRLTANYLAEDVDGDGDGIPDGYELYWYGNLDEAAESDTDGDGYDFAAELAAGTDPLMADRGAVGGIAWDDGVATTVPGEGNEIVSKMATSYLHVYGTDNLNDPMRFVSAVDVDLTPYLNSDTKGEGVATVDLGSQSPRASALLIYCQTWMRGICWWRRL